MSRLKDVYVKQVRPALQKQFSFPNVMQVPRLEKIVLNMTIWRFRAASSSWRS